MVHTNSKVRVAVAENDRSHGCVTIRIGAIIFGVVVATCFFFHLIEAIEVEQVPIRL